MRGEKRGSQNSSILRIWGFFGPGLTAMCYKQCKDDVLVLFPKVLLLFILIKPNGEPTGDWLFFPSPFPQYHPKLQPKGAPSPPHSTIFPHFVPLEAEEVTHSFALDFLQNQQNQPNDPQTEVPIPTPNLTNSWDQPV